MKKKEILTPCPFCGIDLIKNNNLDDLYVKRYGIRHVHIENNCILAGLEVTQSDLNGWQARASLSINADKLDAERYRFIMSSLYTNSSRVLLDGLMTISIYANKGEIDEAIDQAINNKG